MEFRVFIVSMINSSRSAVVTAIDAMFILSFDVCILNIRIYEWTGFFGSREIGT